MNPEELEKEIISLSKEKWNRMSLRDAEYLDDLFVGQAVFVHMGATMSKAQELEVIRNGSIHYKHADNKAVSVHQVSPGTIILLNKVPVGGSRGRE